MLKRKGVMRMNFFAYDLMRPNLGATRWTFNYRKGNAYIESQHLPEAAVAYDSEHLHALCKSVGFSEVGLIPNPHNQSVVWARK